MCAGLVLLYNLHKESDLAKQTTRSSNKSFNKLDNKRILPNIFCHLVILNNFLKDKKIMVTFFL